MSPIDAARDRGFSSAEPDKDRGNMRFRIVLVLAVFGVIILTVALIRHTQAVFLTPIHERVSEPQLGNRVPVLVELFTSEGCSSCPPADDLLARLDKAQPVAGAEVIALSEHVDYWNHLGWSDPYSSAEFSRRQGEYADAFRIDGNYTPQMVVDGQTEFVGSNESKARDEILKASRTAKAAVQITTAGDSSDAAKVSLRVHIDSPLRVKSGDTAEVLIAITEDNLRSNVLRGENGGRSLKHTAVVRKLNVIGEIGSDSGQPFDGAYIANLASGWRRDNLHAVVFVQERGSRRVLGAAAINLAAELGKH
jgi:hypothetical protein